MIDETPKSVSAILSEAARAVRQATGGEVTLDNKGVLSTTCGGAGEIEVGIRQDRFGNWDTETFECRGCPDCVPCPLCDGSGDGDYHPGANVPEPCPACHGRGVDGRKVR